MDTNEIYQLYIPSIGFKMELSRDWTFTLHNEHRNTEFAKRMGLEIKKGQYWWEEFQDERITLPQGTIVKVDRIYIRQNKKDFDSITFRIVECPSNKKIKGRFWTSREDANQIAFMPWTDFSEL